MILRMSPPSSVALAVLFFSLIVCGCSEVFRGCRCDLEYNFLESSLSFCLLVRIYDASVIFKIITMCSFLSSKEMEDFPSTESFGSQQLNLSVGEDSTGSWSNLSFEDDHQDESSSFHHLSER